MHLATLKSFRVWPLWLGNKPQLSVSTTRSYPSFTILPPCWLLLLLFSRSFVSDSLRPHGLQHTRLPCSSATPGACSNSCPSSRWCHPTLFLCRPLLLPSIFPSIRVFSNESALRIRWPKYWSFSFSISPSSEYSGLISFRMDWFNLLAVHGASEESSPTPQFKSINSSALSLLYGPTLTSIHDYWRHHSFDYMDFCYYPHEKADLQGKAALCQVNANATLPLPWWLWSHL